MINIIEKLKKDLKKVNKEEKLNGSHIVFKQKMVCNGKKHTNYYLYKTKEEV